MRQFIDWPAGKGHFPDYYSDGYELAKFKDFLKERITFSYHNLGPTASLGGDTLFAGRNVLIISIDAADQWLRKFSESLRPAVLVLGNRESLNFSRHPSSFGRRG